MSDVSVSPVSSEPAPLSTMRRDIISAYAASAARVISVAVISAVLLRYTHPNYFAAFIVARSVLVLCNYFFAGLAPALQRSLAISVAPRYPDTPQSVARPILNYGTLDRSTESIIYANALSLAAISALICAGLLIMYANAFSEIHGHIVTRYWVLDDFVLWFGVGQVLRSLSEIPGAAIQVRGQIAVDNCLIVAGELIWVWGVCATIRESYMFTFGNVASWFAISGLVLLVARLATVRAFGLRWWFADLPPSWRIMRELLGFGGLVMLGQMADFLYAPAATLIIQSLLGAQAVADYAPAVQVDAGLLLTVGAIAAVLLPKTAAAHAADDLELVRRYYIRGTLASVAILLLAAFVVWIVSPWLFGLWLGDSMPATRAILPLVLVHTVVGGSSAVGRSILLGMGKVKPFTASVLAAGVTNVVLSYVFVSYLNLGLKGIVLGTIIAVTARCALWTPWYVLRQLKQYQI